MISAKEFRDRAAECRRMAEATGDGMVNGIWARLAERWLVCAALAEHPLCAALAEHPPAKSDQAQLSH